MSAIRRDVIDRCGGLNIRAFTESIEFTGQPAVLLAAVTPGARRSEPGERWPGERWLDTVSFVSYRLATSHTRLRSATYDQGATMGRLAAILTLLVLAAVHPAIASAQGSIAGVVTDTSGAVLPGVTVEVASPALIEKVR